MSQREYTQEELLQIFENLPYIQPSGQWPPQNPSYSVGGQPAAGQGPALPHSDFPSAASSGYQDPPVVPTGSTYQPTQQGPSFVPLRLTQHVPTQTHRQPAVGHASSVCPPSRPMMPMRTTTQQAMGENTVNIEIFSQLYMPVNVIRYRLVIRIAIK